MARAVLLILGFASGVLVGLAPGAGSAQWAGALGLAALPLWSGLAYVLGRAVAPVRSAATDPAGEVGVASWLAVALVGLGLTLLWGDVRTFDVPLLWATVLPVVVAYAGLLFDVGRTHHRSDDNRAL